MRTSALILGAAAAGGILLLGALTGGATTLKPSVLSQAARRASAIVVGRVASAECRRSVAPSGRLRIFTDYDVRDLSVLRGSVPTRNVVLSVVGGTLDGRTLRVPGAPHLEEGARYVLLLDPAEPLCGLAGWTRGAYRVAKGPDGIDRVLTFEGRPVAGVEGGRLVEGAEGGAPAMDLASFLSVLGGLADAGPLPPRERPAGAVRREAVR
ncbi:MAG: hypothetical protein L6R43_16845 [Planctomycetes bacterium]|nr:hypothetical protein [Planctomycetota bacterium]